MDPVEELDQRGRYFNNTCPDEADSPPLITSERLRAQIDLDIPKIEEHNKRGRDETVYTGVAGVAAMYYWVHRAAPNPGYVTAGLALLERAAKERHHKDQVGFLVGEPGVRALQAVLYHEAGDAAKSGQALDTLISKGENALRNRTGDEMLFGRAGFLTTLGFVRDRLPLSPAVEDRLAEVERAVVQRMIASGRSYPKGADYPPLMYECYDTEYFGAGHGLAGIVYALLRYRRYLAAADLEAVKECVEYILRLRTREGNYPSQMGDDPRDCDLYHWCHGAPGVAFMFVAAYEAFRDARYLDAALGIGDAVWSYGLLKKGLSLCHGVAGNAYVFLLLYRTTNDAKQLRRAEAFADFSMRSEVRSALETVPDCPYSLFEGIAGTVAFYADMLHPETSSFPCFEVSERS